MLQNGHAIHEEGRLPMLWGSDQDPALLSKYQQLGAFRKDHPEIVDGSTRTLFVDTHHWVYEISDGRQCVIALFNLSPEAWHYSLGMPSIGDQLSSDTYELSYSESGVIAELGPQSVLLLSDH